MSANRIRDILAGLIAVPTISDAERAELLSIVQGLRPLHEQIGVHEAARLRAMFDEAAFLPGVVVGPALLRRRLQFMAPPRPRFISTPLEALCPTK